MQYEFEYSALEITSGSETVHMGCRYLKGWKRRPSLVKPPDVSMYSDLKIATEVLDIMPNPVLVKNDQLEYVWINEAFETLFSVKREQVFGRKDTELFPERQVSQCNGGDLRVLEHGAVDESVETVFERSGTARETITRKSRLTTADNETYLVGIMHDITDVTRANEALVESEAVLRDQALKLSIMATTDILTGCQNRRAMTDYAPDVLNNTFNQAALMLMDIDKFKSINDNHGHDVGDNTLIHFVETVKASLGESDRLYRIGGEEFVLLLNGVDERGASEKAERIRASVASSAVSNADHQISFTVSIGVVSKPKGETAELSDMLAMADKCLYRAKNEGRNRIVLAA